MKGVKEKMKGYLDNIEGENQKLKNEIKKL